MTRRHVKTDDVQARAQDLDEALRCLFRNLEARALPDSLRPDNPANLLDQLLSAPPKPRLRRA